MPRLSEMTLLMVLLSSAVSGCGAMAEDDSLSLGRAHTCIIATGGWLVCLGKDHPLEGVPQDFRQRRLKALVSRGASYCGTYTTGSHACWEGATGYREISAELGLLDLVVGESHFCARLDGNRGVTCWGASEYGQLGGPCPANEKCNEPSASAERRVNLGSGVLRVRQLAAGNHFTCAIVDEVSGEGHVKCWGANLRDQLGQGLGEGESEISIGESADEMGDELKPLEREVTQFDPAGSPAMVPINARKIAVGYYFGCALLEEGRPDGAGHVQCWGYEDQEPSVSGAARLPNPAIDLAVGSGHACALLVGERPDEAVRCWGANDACQLGWGKRKDPGGCDSELPGSEKAELRPVELPDVPARPIALQAGDRHTCARMSDGSIVCWGANTRQQILGDPKREFIAGPAERLWLR